MAKTLRGLPNARIARRWPALSVAVAVLLIAVPALMFTHQSARLPLLKRAAVRAVLADPVSVMSLKRVQWDRTAVGAVDGKLERVSFYEGNRIVFQAAVRADGTVTQSYDFAHQAVPFGNPLAYESSILIGLSILFALAAGVAPLRHIRNLDVLALLSFVAPVVLLQQRYVDWSVLAALPGLLYLIVRCLWLGLGPESDQPAGVPLYLALTSSWDEAARLRVLRMVAATLALVIVAVGVSSSGAVDVIYGVMEGATKLIHGSLPYGHMPGDVVHGDTYPILSYLFYTPLALASPVSSTWDSVDMALGAAALAAIATALILVRVTRSFVAVAGHGARAGGLLVAIAWLSFPPLLITVSTGTTDVLLAAMLAYALLLWRRPASSAAVLTCAGWFKLAPFALVPLWLARLRGARLVRALGAIVAVSAAVVLILVFIGGTGGVGAMIHAVGFQFQRGSFQSPWAALGLSSFQPVGQALVLAFVVAVAVRIGRSPELCEQPQRAAAVSAGILLALQLAADYWSFLYLVWVLPLLAMSMLQPHGAPAAGRSRVAVRATDAVPAPGAA